MSIRKLEIGSEMLRRKIGLTIFDSSLVNFMVTFTINPNLNTLPVTEQYNVSWNILQNILSFFHIVITIPEFTENTNLHYHCLCSLTQQQVIDYNIDDNKESTFADFIYNKIKNKTKVLGDGVLGWADKNFLDVTAVDHPSQDLISYFYKDVDRTIKIGGYGILKYTIRANLIEDLKLEKLVNYKKK